MAGFEDLIRDTLARQGEPTHANRARVYASARSALDRMVAKSEDADAAQAQRENLEAAIERVEDDYSSRFSPASEPEPELKLPSKTEFPSKTEVRSEPEPAPEPAPPPSPPPPPPTVAVAPVVSTDPNILEEPVADPVFAEPVNIEPTSIGSPIREPVVAPTRPSRRDSKRAAKLLNDRPKRRPVAKLLLWLAILGGLLAAGWWLWNNAAETLADLGSAPPPVQIDDAPTVEGDAEWVTVFDPARDIDAVMAGETASTRVVREGDRAWLRLASSADPDAGEGGRVRVRVPPGIMRALSGRDTMFEAVVRAAPGTQPHAFSVICDFPDGRCNRTRFDAGLGEQPFLFAASLGASEEEGALIFDTDLDGLGRAIDLGAIRVAR